MKTQRMRVTSKSYEADVGTEEVLGGIESVDTGKEEKRGDRRMTKGKEEDIGTEEVNLKYCYESLYDLFFVR